MSEKQGKEAEGRRREGEGAPGWDGEEGLGFGAGVEMLWIDGIGGVTDHGMETLG